MHSSCPPTSLNSKEEPDMDTIPTLSKEGSSSGPFKEIVQERGTNKSSLYRPKCCLHLSFWKISFSVSLCLGNTSWSNTGLGVPLASRPDRTTQPAYVTHRRQSRRVTLSKIPIIHFAGKASDVLFCDPSVLYLWFPLFFSPHYFDQWKLFWKWYPFFKICFVYYFIRLTVVWAILFLFRFFSRLSTSLTQRY